MERIEELCKGLSQSQKDELGLLVKSIRDTDHRTAMELVTKAKEPLPKGYVFSHYCVRTPGHGETPTELAEAVEAIKKGLESPSLEVLAVYRPKGSPPNSNYSILHSIMYLDGITGTAYLNGEQVPGKVNFQDLEASLLQHMTNTVEPEE